MSLAGTHVNVGMMTSGGLAPCLASSVAYLVEFWTAALKAGEISGLTLRMYVDGYKGVLTGDSGVVPPEAYGECGRLHDIGGSPIGNSRVKVRGERVWRGGGKDPKDPNLTESGMMDGYGPTTHQPARSFLASTLTLQLCDTGHLR
ncbi:hypothetical protein THAOC_16559 [Thalassiosira oceanica]|uniref:Uncharacterized protein n=1 Tax=Thalassiosira oceanica TaxID=159749 RepID=K0S9K8_THAOC|nr:hypothetical protein THAOC_16559 [Thalassiosira oceanica]|eukprot:EJK62818.1 hypothetical protein THAOC_16559 [Thalassiosira oceanica]